LILIGDYIHSHLGMNRFGGNMKIKVIVSSVALLIANNAIADQSNNKSIAAVDNAVIAQQQTRLSENTGGKGFGPQSPRDIDMGAGNNQRLFSQAPAYTQMNLCNIHFHKNAEHKGGEFTKYAGNGDGKGYGSGYLYAGELTEDELKPVSKAACPSEHGGVYPGDTIELHYVHSSAQVTPGPSLGACLSESIMNPQLRVETQVFVVVNDTKALDFKQLTQFEARNGLYQAANIPNNTGAPIQYAGSTTGPGYNEKGSPLQVSWSVRPQIAKVDIDTVGEWCKDNVFNEDHGHGVRNLVAEQDLLSEIGR
jgi:hypothetical protein